MEPGIRLLLDRLNEMDRSEKRHIVEGAEIWWGNFEDIHEMSNVLPDCFNDPEYLVAAKDAFEKLSGDAKTAYALIQTLDDELFKKNGRAKKLEMEQYLKHKLHCSIRRVREILSELVGFAT
jgi:hypothetical protein